MDRIHPDLPPARGGATLENSVTKPLIAIDGYNLALEQGTGVATYARGLSARLKALGAEERWP